MTEESNRADFSPLQMYTLIRAQIEHEDNLINQRLAWLLASQSFLFTAFAILLNAPEHVKIPAFDAKIAVISQMVPLVGLLSDILIYVSIFAGIIAMRKLRAHWLALYPAHPDDRLPLIQGPAISRDMGHAAPLLLPLIFLLIWGYIFLST
jgi:hypothetical protein